MSKLDSTLPGWQSLSAFCGTCQYNAVCPLMTLSEVENCAFVRDQRRIDLERRGQGKMRLLAQTPLTSGNDIVRDRRGHKRELDYTKTYRARRPLNEEAMHRLVTAVINPEAPTPTGYRA